MKKEQRESIQELIDYCRVQAGDSYDSDEKNQWMERVQALEQILIDLSDVKNQECQLELPLKMEFATSNVPWQRKGYPGAVLTRSQSEWKKDVANTSVSKNRLLEDAVIVNSHSSIGVEERAFAVLWDYEHNGSSSGGILYKLLREEPIASLMRDSADEWLAQLVAQAIIQWLGTNCGSAFVDQARQLAETDRKRLQNEIDFLRKVSDCPAGR